MTITGPSGGNVVVVDNREPVWPIRRVASDGQRSMLEISGLGKRSRDFVFDFVARAICPAVIPEIEPGQIPR